jgi:hypothetical protein
MSVTSSVAFGNWAHDRLVNSDAEHAIYEDDRPLLIDTTEVLALMREAFEAGYLAAEEGSQP